TRVAVTARTADIVSAPPPRGSTLSLSDDRQPARSAGALPGDLPQGLRASRRPRGHGGAEGGPDARHGGPEAGGVPLRAGPAAVLSRQLGQGVRPPVARA